MTVVLGGTNAMFYCNGSGAVLAWLMDGIQVDQQSIRDQGVTEDTVVSSSGTVQSTLTVPATVENNGTVIQCLIGPSSLSLSVIGNSTLTVLPGMSLTY